MGRQLGRQWRVALRKESVDRNMGYSTLFLLPAKSLSARRAWIEISAGAAYQRRTAVALRKESVDRNSLQTGDKKKGQVALRKESVDRNRDIERSVKK